MAIKLGATDTHIVLTALWDYRETLTNAGREAAHSPQVQDKIDRVDRLIASYKKSFFALDRLGVM
jgi:hypothetical protein